MFFYKESEPSFQEGEFGFQKYQFNAGWIDLIHSPTMCGNHSMDMGVPYGPLGSHIQASSPNRIKILTLCSTKKNWKYPIKNIFLNVHLGFPQNK